MSYIQLIADFKQVFNKQGTGVASVDMQNHANDFATAIDNYVSELKDPGKRVPKSTNKSLISISIIPLSAAPGTGNASTDAKKASTAYATGVFNYTLAIVIDIETTITDLPLPYISPSASITSGVITAPTMLTSLESDFYDIFIAETSSSTSIDDLISTKATQFANVIKNAFADTIVTITGQDSTPTLIGGPLTFTLIGPLSEDE